jgi:hypothetical protein
MPALRAAAAACLCLLLGGCALIPDYAGPEMTHESHVTQHFGPDPTNYGSETIGLTAVWTKPGGGPFAQVTEGLALGSCTAGYCGEIAGPREQFTATVGWLFRVKPQT